MKNPLNLVWIDLEMTGLDSQTDHIIEIATIVTDAQLNILERGPVIAIYHPDSVLENMNDWCKEHFSQSGLTERVRQSQILLQEAEEQTIAFIKKYVDKGDSPLCGNSISQDRRFLLQEMPQLEDYFHYRNLDVSSFKEAFRRWFPASFNGENKDIPRLKKRDRHLALYDIEDSIAELQYYRKYFIKDLS